MDFKIITSTKFTPMHDLIVVKPYESFGGKKEEEVSASGLVISLAKEKSVIHDRPVFGKVISVGANCKIIRPEMEIFWDITRGQEIEFKNGEFLILQEETILGFRNALEDKEE